jgi:hypothetical protein
MMSILSLMITVKLTSLNVQPLYIILKRWNLRLISWSANLSFCYCCFCCFCWVFFVFVVVVIVVVVFVFFFLSLSLVGCFCVFSLFDCLFYCCSFNWLLMLLAVFVCIIELYLQSDHHRNATQFKSF